MRRNAPKCFIIGVTLVALVTLVGCGSRRRQEVMLPPTAGELTLAGQNEAVGVSENYRVRPDDELDLRFLYHKELDTSATVGQDGRFTIPGLGDFQAMGLTTEEIEENVYRRASLTYRDPEVAIVVERPTDFRAYVGGEVRRPGYVVVREGITSLRAVFERGGFLDSAKTDHVLHVRWGKAGDYQASILDLKYVLESGNIAADVLLGPNDIVFVPKTAIANADLWVRQYLTELVPIRQPTTRLDDFGL